MKKTKSNKKIMFSTILALALFLFSIHFAHADSDAAVWVYDCNNFCKKVDLNICGQDFFLNEQLGTYCSGNKLYRSKTAVCYCVGFRCPSGGGIDIDRHKDGNRLYSGGTLITDCPANNQICVGPYTDNYKTSALNSDISSHCVSSCDGNTAYDASCRYASGTSCLPATDGTACGSGQCISGKCTVVPTTASSCFACPTGTTASSQAGWNYCAPNSIDLYHYCSWTCVSPANVVISTLAITSSFIQTCPDKCQVGECKITKISSKSSTNTSLLFFIDSDANFRSCNLGPTAVAALSTYFSEDTNPIIDNPICKNLGSWYCDFDTSWKNALIYGANVPVNTKKDITSLADQTGFLTSAQITSMVSCCPSSYCFNGSLNGCEAPYLNPKKPPITKTFGDSGYRCADTGNWSWADLKYDWNHNDSGYCFANSDCYGRNESGINCFKSGGWTFQEGKDHYCENGNWTSRTKFIASELLNYTKEKHINDFTLFCDDYQTTLNQYEKIYPDLKGLKEDAFLTGIPSISNGSNNIGNMPCPDNKCVNNFCILKIDETQIIAATSLNAPVNVTPLGFITALGKKNTDCDSLDPKRFAPCTGSGLTTYYYGDKQIVLFSTAAFPGLSPTGFESFMFGITHPIKSIASFVNSLFTGSGTLTIAAGDYVKTIADLDRLYIAVKGTKSVTGTVETKYDPVVDQIKDFMIINYTGFTQNLCDAVPSDVACDNSAGKTYMFSDQADAVSRWSDLTGKIRIK